jgi:hypothetical protein
MRKPTPSVANYGADGNFDNGFAEVFLSEIALSW